MARRIEQAFRCAPNMPGLGMVMCQPFRLMRDDVGKARFNDLSDASVQLTAPGLGERLIGGFLNERMTKHMDLRRRQAGTINQLVVRELVQSCAKCIWFKGRSGCKHLVREHSANTGGKLSDFFGGCGAIKPRHQRTTQCSWDRRIRHTAAQDIAIDCLRD